MKEISQETLDARKAQEGNVETFSEVINKWIADREYNFRDPKNATKKTFDLLFQSYGSSSNNIKSCIFIKEKLAWLKKQSFFDEKVFFETLLTNTFNYTDKKMELFLEEFQKNKLPWTAKYKLLINQKEPTPLFYMMSKLSHNLQSQNKDALYLNKIMAHCFINMQYSYSKKYIEHVVFEMKNYNFDFMQSFKGLPFIEAVLIKSNHPFMAQPIYSYLDDNYRLGVNAKLLKIMQEYKTGSLSYPFTPEGNKELFFNEFISILEKDYIIEKELLRPKEQRSRKKAIIL